MTITIVEDQALLCDFLSQVVEQLGHRVIGRFADGREALDAIDRDRPEFVILDLYLEGLNGFEVIMELKDRRNPARILVISGHCDDRVVHDIERSGADGFLWKKDAVLADYEAAIDAIAKGRRHFCRAFRVRQETRRQDMRPFHSILTPRDRSILDRLGDGLSRQEIAEG